MNVIEVVISLEIRVDVSDREATKRTMVLNTSGLDACLMNSDT